MPAPIGEAAAWQLATCSRLSRRRRAADVVEWVEPTRVADAAAVSDTTGEVLIADGDDLVRITTAGVIRETAAAYPEHARSGSAVSGE